MKKILALSFALLLSSFQISFAQYSEIPDSKLNNQLEIKTDINRTVLKGGLGVNAGLAFMESSTGLAVGVFAELEAGSFAFVPQANYWQVKKENNFELAALLRMKFPSLTIEPFVDGGIGINFYNNNETNNDDSFQKLGVSVGGGVELKTVSTSFNLIIEGKYKIIINNDPPGNISGYTVTAGMKFPF